MKRHHILQPLSRQHHNALLACLLLKKGIDRKADLKTMQRFVREFWDNDFKIHIRHEEIHLIPFLMEKVSFKHYAFILHNDHQIIERIFERNLNGHLSYRTLQLFAENVEDHIRFEERVVFPVMQKGESGHELNTLHFEESRSKECTLYTEKFWE